MAIIKCKMCGGDMEISADKTFGVCEYCGSTMTLPKVDSEQRAAIFNRGNHFRRICEFDKALAVYERIVAEDDADAEAHWCCALCRFGIEYVEDPATMEWLPTCHRASFDSFLEDVDYLAAVEHSDGLTRRQYQKDAAKIAEVQRGILATSQTADPFDVFICYKETDEQGQRTRDSMLAQDIYYQLTEEGYRVFFSRITLEDLAGTQYEPYIFAALNSAKVMVAVGTKAEYLNAVWVKNEWSRFLALMKKDRSKLLLPCYRDMDPYDLPEQLGVLQSYDMGKIGFIQDLIRGISKVLDAGKKEPEPVHTETVVTQMTGSNVAALLDRGQMAIEDMDWQKADEFFEEVLNQDAKNAVAYLGKYLVSKESTSLHSLASFYLKHTEPEEMEKKIFCGQQKVREQELVQTYAIPNYLPESKLSAMLDLQFVYNSGVAHRQAKLKHTEQWLEDRLLVRAKQYADADMKAKLDAFSQQVLGEMNARLMQAEEEEKSNLQKVEQQYQDFLTKCEQEMKRLYQQAQEKREADYQTAVKALHEAASDTDYRQIESLLAPLVGYKDAAELQIRCKGQAEQIETAKSRKTARMRAVRRGITVAIVAFGLVTCLVFSTVIVPSKNYKKAEELLSAGEEARAAMAFFEAGNWKDASQRSRELWDSIAVRETIEAGTFSTVGVREDGSVVAVGSGSSDLKDWCRIIAVSAGHSHTVGLKENGTVVAGGNNVDGDCNTSNWRNIVAVTTGQSHTVGLKADGTVVATGGNFHGECNVSAWRDIVAIAAGGNHTVGLKADGTVVATGDNFHGEYNVSAWRDIVAIAAGGIHVVGLKSDGTVVATGYNGSGQLDVSEWTDIVVVTAGSSHTVGVKADGTVVAVGDNEHGECDVSGWTNIVAITAGGHHTVGITADGHLVTAGRNTENQQKVSGWTDIRQPNI